MTGASTFHKDVSSVFPLLTLSPPSICPFAYQIYSSLTKALPMKENVSFDGRSNKIYEKILCLLWFALFVSRKDLPQFHAVSRIFWAPFPPPQILIPDRVKSNMDPFCTCFSLVCRHIQHLGGYLVAQSHNQYHSTYSDSSHPNTFLLGCFSPLYAYM